MKFVTAAAIIITALGVAWTRHRVDQWESWIQTLNDDLINETPRKVNQSSEKMDLPEVVKRYFQKVLPPSLSSVVHSVKIHQEGHFMFGSSWVPFEAQETIRAVSPPGFVWDATISMTSRFQQKDLQKSLLPTMQVCDALVDGGKQAYLRAALVNVFDSINAKSTIDEEDDQSEEEDQFLWVGEAMRWLAEAVVVPTALLPEQGMVQWNSLAGYEHRAALRLKDPRPSATGAFDNRHVRDVQLEVEFDPETGYITQVSGRRPYEREILDEQGDLFPLFTQKRTSWEWRRWIGRLSNYKKVAGGMFIPQYMEAGWVNEDGQVELYFKGFNEALVYSTTPAIAKIESYKPTPKPVKEEVVPETIDETTATS